MNYGGPERAEDCEPYLRNIFLDPCLVPIPALVRPLAASWIARRRAPRLRENYAAMGRFSPILEQTEAQAAALGSALGDGWRCLVGMSYWKPLIREACQEIVRGAFERAVLLPLYPQESRATTGSCLQEARVRLKEMGFRGPLREVRSFWSEPGFLSAVEEGVRTALEAAPAGARVLFCAHGLPFSAARKDPYPGQVLATVKEFCSRLDLALDPVHLPGAGSPLPAPNSELRTPHSALSTPHSPRRAALAWQSRVGPMRWLEPSVEEVLRAWASEGVAHAILVPVAFVSEHSETLYELDVLYTGRARDLGIAVTRVPTVQTHPAFVAALARAVREVAP